MFLYDQESQLWPQHEIIWYGFGKQSMESQLHLCHFAVYFSYPAVSQWMLRKLPK